MLKELQSIKQFAGEPKRRWFEDEYFDFEKIAQLFARESKVIEEKIAKVVYERLLQYPVY
ncbi:MAG: hypothetical protein ACREOI_13620 [bacterium]